MNHSTNDFENQIPQADSWVEINSLRQQYIQMYETAIENEDEEMQGFFQEILEVYKKHHVEDKLKLAGVTPDMLKELIDLQEPS